jgi:hypothetical protein
MAPSLKEACDRSGHTYENILKNFEERPWYARYKMGRMRTAREKAEEKSEARNPKSETNR